MNMQERLVCNFFSSTNRRRKTCDLVITSIVVFYLHSCYKYLVNVPSSKIRKFKKQTRLEVVVIGTHEPPFDNVDADGPRNGCQPPKIPNSVQCSGCNVLSLPYVVLIEKYQSSEGQKAVLLSSKSWNVHPIIKMICFMPLNTLLHILKALYKIQAYTHTHYHTK